MSLTAEDLQAIKAIIKEETDPIKADIVTLKSDVISMKDDINTLKSDVATMKEDIEVIKEDIEIIKGVNEEVLEWFDTYQRTDVDKPFPAPVKGIV